MILCKYRLQMTKREGGCVKHPLHVMLLSGMFCERKSMYISIDILSSDEFTLLQQKLAVREGGYM